MYRHSHPHTHIGKKGHKKAKKGRSRSRVARNRLVQFKRK